MGPAQTGPTTAQVVENILSHKAYPEHGFRSCMGIISLAKRYTSQRLESACTRILAIKGISHRSIKSILENNLNQHPLPRQVDLIPLLRDDIRGTEYYYDERKQHAHRTDHLEIALHETHGHGQGLCQPNANP